MGSMASPVPPISADTGRAMALSPLVTRILAPNPSPFTYQGTQTYLVGQAELAVIDPGPAESAHLDALMAAIAGRRVKAILCTHTHRDHSPAAAPLAALTGAPIIGCAPLTLEDDGPRADAAFDPDYAPRCRAGRWRSCRGRGLGAHRRRDARPHLQSSLLRARCREGPVHRRSCHGLVDHSGLPARRRHDGLSRQSRNADAPRRRHYYPAHGEPIPEPQRLVRGTLGHRRMREGQILRHLERQGPSIVPDMVAAMYAAIDPSLHGAAGRSVLAHLIDLQRRKLVVPDGEGWRSLRAA